MKIFLATYQKIFCLIIFFSAFALGSAYFVEYVLHVVPCPLCIYQRIPYFTLIIFSGLGYLINKESISKYLCYLCATAFFIGASIGLYHTGIERGFIEESAACTSNKTHQSIESLKDEIYSNTTSCKEVKFKIGGFSAAEINTIFSLIMFLYILLSIKNLRNEN